MRKRQGLAILVALVAVATTVTGRNSTDQGGEGNSAKKSPRVFVDTSVPFSVAPQPVKDELVVAQAKEKFMDTFEKIREAVVAADSQHLNFTVLNDPLSNNLEEGNPPPPITTTHETPSASGKRGRQMGGSPIDTFDIFPDPKKEPQYFLPSVHVDPVLLRQLNPPLPPNPHIQNIRPIGNPKLTGACYEIVLLEPEPEEQNFLLRKVSQVLPIGTPALPGISSRKPVSPFQGSGSPFLPLLNGGTTAHTRR